ncbi:MULTISPECIES: RICIN domain-containing protein [unclassified Streptomyces]|uniref:RICIN domain-containing protein n=1 Tax=Streptomyces sp. NPDC127532 TaxID=3345399 RepID=UPI003626086D
MARAGRPQGTAKGETEAANDLARFLREATAHLTVREMAKRYGGGKTVWSQYRSGERIVPLSRLTTVVNDRVRDPRGRAVMLSRAHRLHDAALTAEARKEPSPSPEETLWRAETDLEEAGRLVRGLLAIITMLQERTGPPRGPAGEPAARPDSAPGSDRLDTHLDEAFEQLGAVRIVQRAARRLHEEARARSVVALPPAGEDTREATAGAELSLAQVRMGSTLEDRREDVQRLWREIRRYEESQAEPAALEGCVLQRVDTSAEAPVVPAVSPAAETRTSLAETGSSAAGGHGAPVVMADARVGRSVTPPTRRALVYRRGRTGPSSLVILLVAAILGVSAVAAAAVVAIGRQRADPAAVNTWPGVQAGAPAATPAPSTGTPPVLDRTPSARAESPAPPAAMVTPPAPAPATPGAAASRTTPPVTASSPTDPRTPTSGPPPLPNGLLRLTNAASRMCLTVPNGSVNSAEGLVQTGCAVSAEHFWQLSAEETGLTGAVYSIRNRNSGLCLSVDAARTTNNAIITQYTCGDESGLFPDQFWTFRYKAAYRAWQLVNRHSGKCVSVRTGGGDMEQALQEECSDNAWLLWRT